MGSETFRFLYQLRGKNAWGNWNLLSKIDVRRQSKAVPEETPAKPAHCFAKKSYQIQSEFNNSVFEEVKGCLGGRYKWHPFFFGGRY